MKTLLQLLLLIIFSSSSFAQAPVVLPVKEFEKGLQAKNAQLVDVRTTAEYKQGFIPGAINMDWLNEKQFQEQAKKLNKQSPVYLYCLSGVRSGKAANWLLNNGFTQVINLDGGINAWKEAGKKLVTR